MPWCEVFGEECRHLAQNWWSMSVAFVEVDRPEEYHSKDLVLAVAVGRLAEGVVCDGRESELAWRW